MPIPTAPINILTFPQRWDPLAKRLTLNILLLPKGDPVADFAPAFPDARLAFEAHIIPSLEQLPVSVPAGVPPLDVTQDPIERRQFFDAFTASFDRPDGTGFQVKPHKPGGAPAPKPKAVKKYLTSGYREAARFSAPRTRFAVTDGAYECALRDGPSKRPGGPPPPRTFYWEEILSFVLRQPLLAEKLGLLYRTHLDLPAPNPFAKGGYLYVDLAAAGDYAGVARQRFAARMPPLGAKSRAVFAAVLFPVDQPGNYDQVFPEADLYDDGFAKLVHGAQPPRAALLETNPSPLPAPKDVGIRLAWDDEQVAIWLNRQLGINAVDDGLPPPPSPLGIAGYHVDVFDDANGAWQSLMRVQGDLKLGALDIGHFGDELPVEVLPVNSDNVPDGEFWVPSYFAAWAGGSLAVPDRTPFRLANHPDIPGPLVYEPVDADKVALTYGKDYRFRVRLMDLTGGGPKWGDLVIHDVPTAEATVPFRRYVAPKGVTVAPGGGVAPDGLTAAFDVFRPGIAYPDVVFTGKYADPLGDLLAQAAAAQLDAREPALPDPDVTQLQIEVQVRTVRGDPAAVPGTGQPFLRLYKAVRNFPAALDRPLHLQFKFENSPQLAGLKADLLPGDGLPLRLPRARAIRLIFTPLGFEDPALDYWGSQDARTGAAPLTAYLQAPSTDESNLWVAPPPLESEIEAIFLQPDPPPSSNFVFQKAASGLRHEAPADLVQRLAHHIDLPAIDMTFSSKSGQRIVYGCTNAFRHTLNPDASSLTFSSKSDLTRHWVIVLKLTLDRDWSWYAPGHLASLLAPGGLLPPEPVTFQIERSVNGGAYAAVGRITIPGQVNPIAAINSDRDHTGLVFFDGFDPKPAPSEPLREPKLTYRLIPLFRDAIALVGPALEWTLDLPITTPPAQTPRLVSAGFAFSKYDPVDRYSSTRERSRKLFFEFDRPPADPQDGYFARVLANAPDPLLVGMKTGIGSPAEPPLSIDDEAIRVVHPGQSNDFAGWNAMQPLTVSPHSDRHYLLDLPEHLDPESPELFGFFVYELRVGHDRSRWCTAQGRFGMPLRVTGVQQPPPQLRCSVMRDRNEVVVVAPFAAPVFEGENLRPIRNPGTALEGLLYAQVMRVDGQQWRNVLLMRAGGRIRLQARGEHLAARADPRFAPAVMTFPQDDIVQRLSFLGLPLDSSLSVIAVELLPEPDGSFEDPLGKDLGQVRILRATPLTPVPEICPPEVA